MRTALPTICATRTWLGRSMTFEMASTNLVAELSIILIVLLMGWRFMLAEAEIKNLQIVSDGGQGARLRFRRSKQGNITKGWPR
jgi:hypothetical protein